jgi:PEP-CTERM motif
MQRKKNGQALLAGICLALGVSLAQAAPYLPGIQILEDNDAENWLRSETTNAGTRWYAVGLDPLKSDAENLAEVLGAVQVDDLFSGVLKIQETSSTSNADPAIDTSGNVATFTSLFLIQADSVVCGSGLDCNIHDDNSSDVIEFGATDAATWAAIYGAGGLFDITGAGGFDVTDMEGSGEAVNEGTLALFFEGVIYDDADIAAASQTAAYKSFVSGGDLQYEFGYTGASAAPVTGEFWTTTGQDIATPRNIYSTTSDNRISLNVVQQWAGPELLPFNYLGDPTEFLFPDTNFTHEVQLQGKGGFDQITPSVFGITTDTDFYINPVPAPGTLALLALGLLGVGIGARGRRLSSK